MLGDLRVIKHSMAFCCRRRILDKKCTSFLALCCVMLSAVILLSSWPHNVQQQDIMPARNSSPAPNYHVRMIRHTSINSSETGHSDLNELSRPSISQCSCRSSHNMSLHGVDLKSDTDNTPTTTCVGLAAVRGGQQKVISYSFYGPVNHKYFEGIERNLRVSPQFFHNWTARVYLDFTVGSPHLHELICQLYCRYDHVDFCDVTRVPGVTDVEHKFGMVWRFLPLGDPSVERFIVRDTDSLLCQRDSDAVDEWVRSGKGFHVMRDHPDHGAIILGGLWGAHNRDIQLNQMLRNRIIRKARTHRKGEDQVLLASVLAPVIFRRHDVLSHDSYQCRMFPNTRPFPSRRHYDNEILGTPLDRSVRLGRPCPFKCRPPTHQDWTYC